MTTAEFKKAFELAKTRDGKGYMFGSEIDGYGLSDFQPVTVTLTQVADLIRWQAKYFNGDWDSEQLDEIRHYGRRKFIVVDDT